MSSDNTSVNITDSTFLPLQKCRIFSSSAPPKPSVPSLLAVSSTYQLSFAVTGSNLLSWDSSNIHQLKRTSENANIEYTDLPMKSTNVGDNDVITAISVNSGGNFLAVLISNTAGTFVKIYDAKAFTPQNPNEVYPVCSIRVGQESDSTAVCLEWNPAVPDTFAASASDNSLVVAKINMNKPSSYSLIGNVKLGAIACSISWSPKGKQLVVGDSVGKISQLKPELEVVRATLFPKEVIRQDGGRVCGLCWLSTTEWLVAFAFPGVPDIQAFLLTQKKDKPASWIPLPDICFCNPASYLDHCVLCDTTLLLPWNVIFLTSSKSSEVFVLGKVNDSWKIWLLEEESRLDLPLSSSREDTFPIGMSVDLSSTTEVILSEDGLRKHTPSPVLMVLTNDGILMAFNTVSINPAHSNCQIQPIQIDLSKVIVGNKPTTGTPVIKAPETSTPLRPFMPVSTSATPTIAMTTSTPAFTTSAPAWSTSTPTLATSSPALATSTPNNLFTKTPLAATKDVSGMTTAVDATADLEKEKKEKLKTAREQLNASIANVKTEWGSLANDMKSLHIGIQNNHPIVKEFEATRNESTSIVLYELSKLLESLDRQCMDLEEKLKSGVIRGADAMEVILNCEDDVSSFLQEHDDFDRNERMVGVVKAMDDLKEQYASGKAMLDNLKKSNAKKSVPLSTWVIWHDKNIRQIIKSVNSSLKGIRLRVETLEDDTLRIRQTKKSSSNMPVSNGNETKNPLLKVNVLKIQKVPDPKGDVAEMRRRIRELLRAKDANPPKIRNMVPLPFMEATKKTVDQPKANQLLKEMMDKLASPRVIPSPSRHMSDAATQADTLPPPPVQVQPNTTSIANEVKDMSRLDLNKTANLSSTPVTKVFGMPSTTNSPLTTDFSSAFLPVNKSTPNRAGESVMGNLNMEKIESNATRGADNVYVSNSVPPQTSSSSPESKKDITQAHSTTDAPKAITLDTGLTKTDNDKGSELRMLLEDNSDSVQQTTNNTDELTSNTLSKELAPESSAEGKSLFGQRATVPKESTKENTNQGQSIFGQNSVGSPQDNAITTKNSGAPDPIQNTSIFGSKALPETSVSTDNKVAASFSLTGSDTQKSSSNIFGTNIIGNAADTGNGTPKSTNIFGTKTMEKAAEPASTISSFGSFGVTKAPTSQENAAPTSSFSFKPASSTAQPAPSFSFAPKPIVTSAISGFAAAAAKAATEDGMMEEENMGAGASAPGQSTGSIFGGGFMSSFGNSTPSNTEAKSVFGGAPSNPQKPQGASIFSFSGNQTQASTGGFGSFGSSTAPKSSFGAAAQQAAAEQPATSPSVFGGAAKFGAAPAFGAKPSFGSPSAFGAAVQPKPSVFGGASSGSGFAAFAGKSFGSSAGQPSQPVASVFGSGASQHTASSSIFGGGSQQSKPSAFGGASNSSFTAWR